MVSVSIHLSTRHRWENVRSDDEDVAQDHRSINGNDDIAMVIFTIIWSLLITVSGYDDDKGRP